MNKWTRLGWGVSGIPSPQERARQRQLAVDHLEACLRPSAVAEARRMAYEDALDLCRKANREIGIGVSLDEEERAGIYLNGRIQGYLFNRLERGDEIFERERREAGDGTERALIYFAKKRKGA